MALVKAERETWRMTTLASLIRGVKIPGGIDPFMPMPKASDRVAWQASAKAMKASINQWDKRVRPKTKRAS